MWYYTMITPGRSSGPVSGRSTASETGDERMARKRTHVRDMADRELWIQLTGQLVCAIEALEMLDPRQEVARRLLLAHAAAEELRTRGTQLSLALETRAHDVVETTGSRGGTR
jgi:hypothetical protein